MPNKDLRLLALDGGGVRGLSALIILQRLMETIDPETPPKPCEYFDMIGGTSTGGLIAVMLGRLRMSIDECIDAYLLLSDRIFQKKRHRVTIGGNIQGRFDSEELAQAMKEVVTARELQEDALLKDISDNACKTFVCATSKQTSETVCLTSYKSPLSGSDLLNSVKIWEACCATSAASSFFDPIAIGRYGEEFVDGATGANNPVWEVWNQAQLTWGPEPLESRIKCLVSIGTGVPSLKPFQDDVFYIGKTLVAITTETEQTAERFRRDKSQLDNSGRYYRFNVDRGLEDIGLEESKKRKNIAAATRRYVRSQGVLKQMQACADNLVGREYFGEYRTVFSLEGVFSVSKFVGRLAEIAELERVLLPKRQSCRQKILVLHRLGGIGKTQLAVEFALQHHHKFSTVFWLDGRSEDSLMWSITSCASRIPKGQISESSRTYSTDGNGDINIVVQEVRGWLAQQYNTDWLLIFDNVDRDYSYHNSDLDAYDIRRYFSSADHGSVLITTRLAKLEQLGDSQQLGKINQDQAEAILQSRYKRKYNRAESERSLDALSGMASHANQEQRQEREGQSKVKKHGILLLQILKGHSRPLNSVTFSPDGKLVASGSDDGTVRLWDSATGALRGKLEGHSNGIRVVVFSPDGKLVASGSSDRTVRLWDSAMGTPLSMLEGHSSNVIAVAFSPDSKLMASGSHDGTARLWDITTGVPLCPPKVHSEVVWDIAFSPDGKLVISGSGDGTARLWNAATGAPLGRLDGHPGGVSTVAFSPNGKLVACGSCDGTIKLWDPVRRTPFGTLEAHVEEITDIAFSPDGKLVASGSYDWTVRLWNSVTGALLSTLEGHSNSVRAVTFSPDGMLVASGSYDGTARLWDSVTGAPLSTLEGHSGCVDCVVFSPDGKLATCASHDKMVRLWG